MHGQKQIYMFLMFIIFITALNFCRKAIKRDKELKNQRDDDIKRKVDSDIINQKLKMDLLLQQQEIQRQKNIIYRMYEQKDKCFDLYIFGNKPKNDDNKFEKDKTILITNVKNEIKCNLRKDNVKQNNNNLKPKKNNHFFEPINYLFVLVLIYFLIKAVTDIKQHYKQKTEEVKAEDGRRRYSLQNYAERKNLKVNRSTIFTTINNTNKRNSTTKLFKEEHSTRIIPNYINTDSVPIIDTRITLKTIGKKPTLLRRCSVPILTMTNTTSLRQSSIDSATEYDSSPELKRRVRMIQRH